MDSIQKIFYSNLVNLFNPNQGGLFRGSFCGEGVQVLCQYHYPFRSHDNFNSLPIRKKHKIKQQEIINFQGLKYFVFQQFQVAFRFFIKRHSKILGHFAVFARRPNCLIYYCHFFVIFSPTERTPFFMHNISRYLYQHLIQSRFFLFCLKRSFVETQKFSVLRNEKMRKTKTTE